MTIKTEWDLSQLYKSIDDPQIEKDLNEAEKAYVSFAKKYKRNSSYLRNEIALSKILSDSEALDELPASKSAYFLHLSQDLNSLDQNIRARTNLITQRLQKMGNLVVFFGINLSKIPVKDQKRFLASKRLSKYRYFLKKTFESGKYVLTEPEEKILSLKSLTSHLMWTDSLEKMMNKQEVKIKRKNIPLAEASFIAPHLPTQKDRIEAHNAIIQKYYELGDVAESEINAIITDKKINDELRGFKEPYDATILSYENDKETILNLSKTVTMNFNLPKRFYRIKAKMLKLKRLTYADRSASVGKTTKKVTFNESCEILLSLFKSIDLKFYEILNSFLINGQIDVYPKVGKAGGAYSAHIYNMPGFVLLNHTGDLNSLSTFAHEMGHTIHSEFSKSQPVFYDGYSMSTAEVASTLFEYFLFYDQFEKLSEEEKVLALHDKIQDDVSTIFRQISFFNFEVEMHNTIRSNGSMSKEDLAKLMNKHLKSYMGSIELTGKDGYLFVAIPHIRRFFYVYSYAFGRLASKALYKKYSEDKTYIEKIKKFMSTGGSMSPEDTFKQIGVDVKKPDFWKLGIKGIEEDIKLLEKLVNKQPLKASVGRMTKK